MTDPLLTFIYPVDFLYECQSVTCGLGSIIIEFIPIKGDGKFWKTHRVIANSRSGPYDQAVVTEPF